VLKVKVKGHVIRELSWILGMSYSVIDGLVGSYLLELDELSKVNAFSLIRFVRTTKRLL